MNCNKGVGVCLISQLFFVWPAWTIVTETTQSYNCTEDLHHVESEYAMKNPGCDQYWSAQEHSIGTFLRFIPECHSPCKELFLGRIILMECVNITLAVICGDVLTEHRVHFYGKMVPQLLHNPVKRDRIGIFLAIALLAIALLAIACLLGAGCANRNKPLTEIWDEESFQ